MSNTTNGQRRPKAVASNAVEQTLALNPLIGLTGEDLLRATSSTAYKAVTQPMSVLRATAAFARRLTASAAGEIEIKPAPRDRRFQDPTWTRSRLHKGLLQTYLALNETLDEWVDDAGFDEVGAGRARFVTRIISDSIAPTNFLLGNPTALKQLVETGGASIVRGIKNLVQDQRVNHGMPSQVDKSRFEVGVNLATTEGSVVFRNEMLELIQYSRRTDNVYRRPVLFIPPQINKYYVFDLIQEKSLLNYSVEEGLQTFTVSWRNPKVDHADWGVDRYVEALKEAIEVVKGVSGSQTINVFAACSGGITTMLLAGHLNAIGDKTINSITLPVCVLQQETMDSDLSLFMDASSVELARANSRRKGVLRGRDLARVFSWMRPNDLVWAYVINNYLLGNSPPAHEILFWNNDPTNVPAQLHSDFLDIVGAGALARPGDLIICGTEIDLTELEVDLLMVGGLTDHITPWQACYRTTHCVGGKKEFLLTGSGHVQTLTTAPGNPRAKFYANTEVPGSAEEWLEGSMEHEGSWWEYWNHWIRARSGSQKKATVNNGSKVHPPLCDAPGIYVHEPAN